MLKSKKFSLHFRSKYLSTKLNFDGIYQKQRAFLRLKIIAIKTLSFIANAITNNIFKTYCNCNKNNEKLLQ